MANKRCFSMQIVDSDAFLDMPLSTQCLYFHLNMRADDDGFVDNTKRIMRMIGASEDDLKILLSKSFILAFENGVIVVKHWRIHNTLSKSRYSETNYAVEKSMLLLKDNKAYSFNEGVPLDDSKLVGMWRTDGEQVENTKENKIKEYKLNEIKEKENKTKESKSKYGEYSHVLLSDQELDKLKEDYGSQETFDAIKYLDEYIEMNGRKYKNHNLVLRKWVFDALKNKNQKPQTFGNGSIVDKWANA